VSPASCWAAAAARSTRRGPTGGCCCAGGNGSPSARWPGCGNGCVDHDPSGQILSAWIAKEELRTLCATAARGAPPGEIRDRLYAFYRWCTDADIPELTTLAETIDTWWPAIQVFLTTGLTNARTEGTNR
jgi:transposase